MEIRGKALSTVFLGLGWIFIVIAAIFLYIFVADSSHSTEKVITSGILLFSGLLLLAIAEVIKLLGIVEYNTRKQKTANEDDVACE